MKTLILKLPPPILLQAALGNGALGSSGLHPAETLHVIAGLSARASHPPARLVPGSAVLTPEFLTSMTGWKFLALAPGPGHLGARGLLFADLTLSAHALSSAVALTRLAAVTPLEGVVQSPWWPPSMHQAAICLAQHRRRQTILSTTHLIAHWSTLAVWARPPTWCCKAGHSSHPPMRFRGLRLPWLKCRLSDRLDSKGLLLGPLGPWRCGSRTWRQRPHGGRSIRV